MASLPLKRLQDMPRQIPGFGGGGMHDALLEQRAQRPVPLRGEAWEDHPDPTVGASAGQVSFEGTWAQYCALVADKKRQ